MTCDVDAFLEALLAAGAGIPKKRRGADGVTTLEWNFGLDSVFVDFGSDVIVTVIDCDEPDGWIRYQNEDATPARITEDVKRLRTAWIAQVGA